VVGTTGRGVSGLSVAGGLAVVCGTCWVGRGVRTVGMKVLGWTGRAGRAARGAGAGVGADLVATRFPRFSLTNPSTPMTSYPTPAPAL